MQNFFVTIVEDDVARLFKVAAKYHVEAKILALAAYNGVNPNEIDLECAHDMGIHVTLASDVEDLTA